jgi:hypothetical protein
MVVETRSGFVGTKVNVMTYTHSQICAVTNAFDSVSAALDSVMRDDLRRGSGRIQEAEAYLCRARVSLQALLREIGKSNCRATATTLSFSRSRSSTRLG